MARTLKDYAAGHRPSGIGHRKAPAKVAKYRGKRGISIRVVLKEGIALKGARAFLVVKRAAEFGKVVAVEPALAALQREEFEREFTIRLAPSVEPALVAEALRAAGAVSY